MAGQSAYVVPLPSTRPEADGAVFAGAEQVALLVEAQACYGGLVVQQSPNIHMLPHVVQPDTHTPLCVLTV